MKKLWQSPLLAGAFLFGLPMLWILWMTLNTTFNFDIEAAKVVDKTSWEWTFGETQIWYLLINVGVIFFPFVLSFDKKVAFFKLWGQIFPAILLTGGFFIAWDVYFTHLGIWGFNERYINNWFLGLPLGEWLFFFTVPYACVFIHECLKAYISRDWFKSTDKWLSPLLIIFFLFMGIFHGYKAYTSWTFLLCAGMMIFHLLFIPNTYRTRFYLAYIISLIPFALVNGILTGAFNQEPVVLYNDAHNLSSWLQTRFITIPFDDFAYAYLLLMMNITWAEWFYARKAKQITTTQPSGTVRTA